MTKKMNPFITLFALSGLILIVASIALFPSLPPQIPLFYSLPDGESQIVDVYYILVLPGLALAITAFNMLLSKKLFQANEFITSLFRYVSLTVVVMFTIIYLRILFLVS